MITCQVELYRLLAWLCGRPPAPAEGSDDGQTFARHFRCGFPWPRLPQFGRNTGRCRDRLDRGRRGTSEMAGASETGSRRCAERDQEAGIARRTGQGRRPGPRAPRVVQGGRSPAYGPPTDAQGDGKGAPRTRTAEWTA